MNDSERTEIIRLRLENSQTSLDEANLLIDNEYWNAMLPLTECITLAITRYRHCLLAEVFRLILMRAYDRCWDYTL